MEEKIVMLRLYNGDTVIGKTSSAEDSEKIDLVDPRAIAIVPTMSGSVRVAIGSICEPFKVSRLKEKFSVPRAQVMFDLSEDEIDKELINGYKSEITGIKIASASETASLNANPKPGEFIL